MNASPAPRLRTGLRFTFRTCYLFITTEFNGSFHWLEVRRISPDESRHEKNPVFAYAKNKDADQPANPCSLFIVFVNRCLDRTIYVRNSKLLVRILSGANQFEFYLAEKSEGRFSRYDDDKTSNALELANTAGQMSRIVKNKLTKYCVRPAKTQICLAD